MVGSGTMAAVVGSTLKNADAALATLTTAHSWTPEAALWNGCAEMAVTIPAAGTVTYWVSISVPAVPTPPGKCQNRTTVWGAAVVESLWMTALIV